MFESDLPGRYLYLPGDRIGEADGNRATAQIPVGIYTYGDLCRQPALLREPISPNVTGIHLLNVIILLH
jgi:hypothetical protein